MTAGARNAVRGLALLGSVVLLALAGWLVRLLPGPQLVAVLGLGPVDGTLVVSECYEAPDAEGYPGGTECKGVYTPRAAAGPPRELLLDGAAAKHEPGSAVSVRIVRGKAYEPSGPAVGHVAAVTGFLLVPFLTLASWLLGWARRGRAGHGAAHLLAALAALAAVLVLSVAAALLVALVTALR
ncbi:MULTISPECIES: hypothetical protein [Streptomyces]|uniref:hypothetical protein n=1 Tax=Streptomyces TaxID=1883 RepID=UPI000A64F61D|nr:hypothetical protein [Streptomyces katrae]